jgi:hypothetical protein
MQRRPTPRVVLALGAVAILAACSGDRPAAPTQADVTLNVRGSWPEGCDPISQKFINLLFPPGTRGDATSRFQHVQNEVWRGNVAGARSNVVDLLAFTMNRYRGGELLSDRTGSALARVDTLAKALYCFLDPDIGAVEVIGPGGGQVIAGDRGAGVDIPAGAVQRPVLIAISKIAKSEYPNRPGPLNTDLQQFGPFYHIEMIPSAPSDGERPTAASGEMLREDARVQMCPDLPPDGELGYWSSVFVAHNTGQTIEILEYDRPFYNCPGSTSASIQPRDVLRLAHAGSYGKAATSLGTLMASYLAPKPLYAAAFGSLGIGGKTKSFSPFGVVYDDPEGGVIVR